MQELVLHEKGPGGKGGRSTRALSLSKLMNLDGLTALDLGAKEGYNAFDLYECGCSRVLGVELRDRFVEEALRERDRLGYDSVNFRQADVRKVDELGLGKFDLCLCSGILYHMADPLDLLRRISRMCTTLALETQVSPPGWAFYLAGKKYRIYLDKRQRSVTFDGVTLTGRHNTFPSEKNMLDTSGSVDSHRTFWPSYPSLLDALRAAGFQVTAAYYRGVPAGQPEILVDHGLRRSKVFIVCRVSA